MAQVCLNTWCSAKKHQEQFSNVFIVAAGDPQDDTVIVNVSTMNLSSVNGDVLLYLIQFVDPVDRFNLVLSGILKGFENVNKKMDLSKRYSEHFILVQCK